MQNDRQCLFGFQPLASRREASTKEMTRMKPLQHRASSTEYSGGLAGISS